MHARDGRRQPGGSVSEDHHPDSWPNAAPSCPGDLPGTQKRRRRDWPDSFWATYGRERESAGVVVAGPDRREAVLSPTNGYSHSLHTDLGILRIYTVCSCVSSKAREVVYSDPLSPDVVGEPRLRTNLASWRLFGGQFSKRRRCGGASEPRDESPPSGRHAGTTHRAGLTTT